MRRQFVVLALVTVAAGCSKPLNLKEGWTNEQVKSEIEICEKEVVGAISRAENKSAICKCWIETVAQEMTRTEFDSEEFEQTDKVEGHLIACGDKSGEAISLSFINRFFGAIRTINQDTGKTVRRVLEKARVKAQAKAEQDAALTSPSTATTEALVAQAQEFSRTDYGRNAPKVVPLLEELGRRIDAGADANAKFPLWYDKEMSETLLGMASEHGSSAFRSQAVSDAWNALGLKALDRGAKVENIYAYRAVSEGNDVLLAELLKKDPHAIYHSSLDQMSSLWPEKSEGRKYEAATRTAKLLLSKGSDINHRTNAEYLLPHGWDADAQKLKLEALKVLKDAKIKDLSTVQKLALEGKLSGVIWYMENGAKITKEDLDAVKTLRNLCVTVYLHAATKPSFCTTSYSAQRTSIELLEQKLLLADPTPSAIEKTH